MQETEIVADYPINLLKIPGFNMEIEINNLKARTGIYLSEKIPHTRRLDLEDTNSNLLIVDLQKDKQICLINRCDGNLIITVT